eukprot:2817930-Rhodomonas_salina.4
MLMPSRCDVCDRDDADAIEVCSQDDARLRQDALYPAFCPRGAHSPSLKIATTKIATSVPTPPTTKRVPTLTRLHKTNTKSAHFLPFPPSTPFPS